MSEIKNIEGRTLDDINRELSLGGRFVVFQYCISIVIMTFRRNSDIYFIPSGESATKHSMGYTLSTFLLGWWGVPWGPIYTIGSIYTNVNGGKDVTKEVMEVMNGGLN